MDFGGENICPACSRYFRTQQGVQAHLSAAKSCLWWRKGKLAELLGDEDELAVDQGILDSTSDQDDQDDEMLPEDAMEEVWQEEQDLYHFIGAEPEPEPTPAIGEAGPGPSSLSQGNPRVLDEDDNSRFEEIHPTAGRVIRMSESLHKKWRRMFRETSGGSVDADGDVEMDREQNQYAPFASELDWRVAKWAVEDGPGHNAFNRLLKIPGVRFL